MKTYPLAEAKAKLSGLVDEVSRRDERVTITKHGRPAAVLMSPNEVESIEATLEIMSDPEFYAEILRHSAALDRGEGVEMTLEEIFGEEVPAARDRAKARAAASGRRPAPPAAARSTTKSARVPARPPARRGRRWTAERRARSAVAQSWWVGAVKLPGVFGGPPPNRARTLPSVLRIETRP